MVTAALLNAGAPYHRQDFVWLTDVGYYAFDHFLKHGVWPQEQYLSSKKLQKIFESTQKCIDQFSA